MFIERQNYIQYVCDRCGGATPLFEKGDLKLLEMMGRHRWKVTPLSILCPVCNGKEISERWRGVRMEVVYGDEDIHEDFSLRGK